MRYFRQAAVAAVAAVLILAGTATGARASSFNCVLGAGCGTLHSADAAGRPAAVDAKRQNPHGIVIGYPDLAKDRATSFDKVLHYYNGTVSQANVYYTLVYAPDGNWTDQCVTASAATGKLSLQVCTLGLDAYQRYTAHRFTAGGGAAEIGGNTWIGTYDHVTRYLLRNDGTGGYMRDSSAAVPTVPQPDAADSRQLDANGVTPAAATAANPFTVTANELWTWDT